MNEMTPQEIHKIGENIGFGLAAVMKLSVFIAFWHFAIKYW